MDFNVSQGITSCSLTSSDFVDFRLFWWFFNDFQWISTDSSQDCVNSVKFGTKEAHSTSICYKKGWFRLIFVDFRWMFIEFTNFLLVSIDFQQFSLILTNFHQFSLDFQRFCPRLREFCQISSEKRHSAKIWHIRGRDRPREVERWSSMVEQVEQNDRSEAEFVYFVLFLRFCKFSMFFVVFCRISSVFGWFVPILLMFSGILMIFVVFCRFSLVFHIIRVNLLIFNRISTIFTVFCRISTVFAWFVASFDLFCMLSLNIQRVCFGLSFLVFVGLFQFNVDVDWFRLFLTDFHCCQLFVLISVGLRLFPTQHLNTLVPIFQWRYWVS